MIFKEWYKKHREYNYDAVYAPHESEVAWNACKNEVLKILDKYKFNMHDTQLNHDVEQVIDLEVIEEIKKL